MFYLRNILSIVTTLAVASVMSSPQSDSAIGKSKRVGRFTAQLAQAPAFDFALPVFSDYPLLVPRGVDPLAYMKTGIPTHTVYLDDVSNSCPKAPSGCGIYSGHVDSTGGGSGLTKLVSFTGHADFTDLNTLLGTPGSAGSGWSSTGSDQADWDIWVTHGATLDSVNPWAWPDNFGAVGYAVFHSDCVEFSQYWSFASLPSPCSSTNDYGYNPRGRQVTTHGGEDLGMNPPVPNMGIRNRYGDGSVLGYPAVNSPVPVTSSAYPSTNCAPGAIVPCTPSANPYNDIANMWHISSSNNSEGFGATRGSVLLMGAAHTNGLTCGSITCPDDGVNHIVVMDAHFFPDPAGHQLIAIDLQPAEWNTDADENPLLNAIVAAAPHDIFFSEDLFTSDADEDGFFTNNIASFVRTGCVRCGITHSALYGDARNAEGHGISFGPPGPMLFDDNFWEGNSVPLWLGGGGLSAICADGNPLDAGKTCTQGLLTADIEHPRNTYGYNPRWLISSHGHGYAGIQGDNNTATAWSVSSGNLLLTLKKSVGDQTGGNIFNPAFFIESAPTGLTGLTAPLWYGGVTYACNGTPCSHSNQAAPFLAIVPCSTCAGAGGTATFNVFGFEALVQGGVPFPAVSISGLNAKTCGGSAWGTFQQPCDPVDEMASVFKNLTEGKEGQASWGDGERRLNGGVQGQEGQCSSDSSRACSGVSKCYNGYFTVIHDQLQTNSSCQHAVDGMLHGSRSGDGASGCWSDVSNSKCSSPPGSTTPFYLTSVTCDPSSGPSFGYVIDFTYNANPSIGDADQAVSLSHFSPSTQGMTGTDVYVYGITDTALGPLMPQGWYQTENISYGSTIPVYLPAGETCVANTTYSPVATLVGHASNSGSGEGVSFGMHHMVAQNIHLYDIGNYLNWNGGGGQNAVSDNGAGHNYAVRVIMGPASLITDPVTGHLSCTSAGQAPGTIVAGVACAQPINIDSCPAATYGSIPDCPRVLQAEVGDLMTIVCPPDGTPIINCSLFATAPGRPAASGGGDPGNQGFKGLPIIDLDPHQLWYTYAPPGYSITNAGLTATIPLEPPQGLVVVPNTGAPLCPGDCGSSGMYASQSYPKGVYYNHFTIVGVNGMAVNGASFQTNVTFKNFILAVPGVGETSVFGSGSQCSGSIPCGFTSPTTSDAYSGPTVGSCAGGNTNLSGITNMVDGATLNFLDTVVVARTVNNYPLWIGNTPFCSNDGFVAKENTTPTRTSTPGSSVTCNGGHPCDTVLTCLAFPTSCFDAPDSIGFVGAMNTNNFPLNLGDPRGYVLDQSSPYKAGALLQADDGGDNGANIPWYLNARARTIRPILQNAQTLAGGIPTYYHDGPQYEWLTWSCSGSCTAFQVFEDGVQVLSTSNEYAQVYGLGINSVHIWNVTATSGTISNLTATMY